WPIRDKQWHPPRNSSNSCLKGLDDALCHRRRSSSCIMSLLNGVVPGTKSICLFLVRSQSDGHHLETPRHWETTSGWRDTIVGSAPAERRAKCVDRISVGARRGRSPA